MFRWSSPAKFISRPGEESYFTLFLRILAELGLQEQSSPLPELTTAITNNIMSSRLFGKLSRAYRRDQLKVLKIVKYLRAFT